MRKLQIAVGRFIGESATGDYYSITVNGQTHSALVDSIRPNLRRSIITRLSLDSKYFDRTEHIVSVFHMSNMLLALAMLGIEIDL